MATPNPEHLFPVDVTMPDGTVHKTCRAITSPQGTTIWVWSRAARSGAVLALSPEKPRLVDEPAHQYALDVPGDEPATLILNWQNHCACSSPMKRWQPPKPNRVGS